MVSAVGQGAIAGAGGVEGATRTLNEAIDLGINFVDTSREYAHSEERIGPVLKQRRDDLYVCTKTHERDKAGAARQIHESLELLLVDTIDIYMLHNVTGDETYEKVSGPGGALEALKEAREAGKIAHIGISSHDLNTAVRAARSGEFEVLEIPFSAVENSEQHFEMIELANKLDIGVVAMKPLSGGNLSNPELALRYVLQYDISTALPGARKPEEAHQNAMVGWDPRPLSADEKRALFEEARALGETFCRRCGYCMPCTVGIDIPGTFTLDTQARAAITRGEPRILEIVRKGYSMVPVKADECVDDGVCEERCPYHLPIGEMMRAARERLMPSSSKPL
jgi:predicted aldo/keto reductase-like oxidoreductase